MPRTWIWLQLIIGWLPVWALYSLLIASAHGVSFWGAGFAGLASAHALAAAGRETLVLEAGPVVGGLSRTETFGEFRFDLGELVDAGYVDAPESSPGTRVLRDVDLGPAK